MTIMTTITTMATTMATTISQTISQTIIIYLVLVFNLIGNSVIELLSYSYLLSGSHHLATSKITKTHLIAMKGALQIFFGICLLSASMYLSNLNNCQNYFKYSRFVICYVMLVECINS